jgi:hypothetical protein
MLFTLFIGWSKAEMKEFFRRIKPGLTLRETSGKKAAKVFPIPENWYSQWRLRSGNVLLFHENTETPPEKLVQALWQHQRLRRGELRTLDNLPVRILHPGFLNREGGPDFKGAVIQFDHGPILTGDVEVDLHAQGWRAHGHDRNPAFSRVILHVLWSGEKPARPTLPTLVIGNHLDAPLPELCFWLSSESADVLPANQLGRCCAPLRDFDPTQLAELLRQAGFIRFHAKAAWFQAQARQTGWEQALWEGLFRALGYKHNAWPMQCLAERRAQWMTPRISTTSLQARFMGISGLLPLDLTRAQRSADGYLRELWDQWWREREEFEPCILPRRLWRFHGQRPANHPERRLALAAHWLTSGNLVKKLERWCAAKIPDRQLVASLLQVLQCPKDEFWSWHWTTRSPRLARPQPLLGTARVSDLAANVILPWLWIRAVEGKADALRETVEHRFCAWPAGEDNSVLRMGRRRLLGSDSKRPLRGILEQQGLIQITRDFCDHSNAICDHCQFPALARQFQSSGNMKAP